MLWDYLCNAKSHFKSASIDGPSHASIYKQAIVERGVRDWESAEGGLVVVMDEATQGNPKWQTLDKTKGSSAEP